MFVIVILVNLLIAVLAGADLICSLIDPADLHAMGIQR